MIFNNLDLRQFLNISIFLSFYFIFGPKQYNLESKPHFYVTNLFSRLEKSQFF